jgi:type IV pilus assembly protein PilA
MSTRAASGFTLIELMIVVAIIAILAAIALPAYQDYLVRAQASEGLVLASGARAAIWDFVSNTGRLPGNNQSAGLAMPVSISGNYVSSVAVGAGMVNVTFGNDANAKIAGQVLLLSPRQGDGSLLWICRSATLPGKYLPTPCRN